MSEEESVSAFSEIRAVTSWALTQLTEHHIPLGYIAEYVPPGRFWGIPRPAKMVRLGQAWHLGVLLMDPDGNLFRAGESTLVEDLPHTSHNSPYRAERRQYADAAYRARFPVGSVVFFDVAALTLDAEDLRQPNAVVFTRGKHAYVRWRAGASEDESVLFSEYISERLELLINPP